MRGTLARIGRMPCRPRIIPAYAGNTPDHRRRKSYQGDHPRVCGEHLLNDGTLFLLSGSSPRMRGTLTGCPHLAQMCGIIPAYAGNTLHISGSKGAIMDHPRVCGEHLGRLAILPTRAGSSPRMRGTRGLGHLQRFQAGIIPAYAGNTISAASCICSSRDHPRVCGEHTVHKLKI